jgi:SAM-dependent methyltransferase
MWNERYSQPGFAYGTEPNDFLRSVAAKIPRGKILSLAEGEGRNATFLASLGCDVTAVDSSEVGLAKAKELARGRGFAVKTVLADLASYQIAPDAWNGIVSIFCHLPKTVRQSVHRAVVSGLKPGGVFVLEAYTPRQLSFGTGGPKSPEFLMSLDELRSELVGLRLLHAAELDRDVIEGSFHTGRASVVQILALKD